MRVLCFLGLLPFASAAHPVRQEIVDFVNKGNASWLAVDVEKNMFAQYTVEEIQGLMGARDYKKKPQAEGFLRTTVDVGTIPASFDARDKWPSCKKPIRDQAHCGSCWAFAAAETLTDNLCVLGTTSTVLSPQNLVSCDKKDHACEGGSLLNVWDYIKDNGIETDAEAPYESGTGSCNNTCVPACSPSETYKCPVDPQRQDTDEDIQKAIMTTGAVEVAFSVMEDFMNYKSGVYQYKSGIDVGGHAVKVIGWGQEEGFYWLVQNSWGANWGEGGYFRIRNWHDDKESIFAMGGGFSCVQGGPPSPTPSPPSPTPAPPSPPSPTPPSPPSACHDDMSPEYCHKYQHKDCKEFKFLIPVCRQTCGCCEPEKFLRPDYCDSQPTAEIVV